MDSVSDQFLNGTYDTFPIGEKKSMEDLKSLRNEVNATIKITKQLSLKTVVHVTRETEFTDSKEDVFCETIQKTIDNVTTKYYMFDKKVRSIIRLASSYQSGDGSGGCFDGYQMEFEPMKKVLKDCLDEIVKATDFFYRCQEMSEQFKNDFDVTKL